MSFRNALKTLLSASLALLFFLLPSVPASGQASPSPSVQSAGSPAAVSSDAPHQHDAPAVTGRVGWTMRRGDAELDGDGCRTGYLFELFDAIARKEQIRFEYVQAADRNEIRELFSKGEIDLCLTDGYGPYSDDLVLLPRSAGPLVKFLCVRGGDSRFCADDFPALNGMTLALPAGADVRKELDALEREKGFVTHRQTCASHSDVRTTLLLGNADVAVLDNYDDTEGLVVLSQFGLSDRQIIIRRGCPELEAAVSRGMEGLFQSDPFYLCRLHEKYFEAHISKTIAFSREELLYIQNAAPLTVYLHDDIPHVAWFQNGDFTGYFPSLLRKISQRTGLKFNLIACNDSDELVSAVKSDPAKNSICIIPRSSRFLQDEDLHFIEPGSKSSVVFLRKLDWHRSIASVGFPEHGYSFQDLAQQRGLFYREYKSEEEGLDALLRGEVDAVMMESYRVQVFMNSRKYRNQLSVSAEPDQESEIAFVASSAADSSLLSILHKVCQSYSERDPLSYMRESMVVDYGSVSFWDVLLDNWYVVLLVLIVFGAALIIIILQHRFTRKLEASNRNKDVFLADMSHDFRTPLTAISGFAYLGKTENDPRYYPEIITSVAYMQELVNDILNIRQYSEGKSLELQPEPLVAETLYDSILSVMHGRASAKKIRIDFESDISYPYIVVDPMRVRQMFVNIIGNAIKYSASESVVEVKVSDYVRGHGVRVRATITDHGEGMSQDFIKQRIFRPFEREKNAFSAKEGGSGLGLAITKIIMDRLGGTISVESELGKGSTFTLDFPEETITKEEYDQRHKEDGAAKGRELDFTGLHVLLCEDNEINTFIVSNILQKRGFIVDCAENGKVGLDTFMNSAIGYYQLILMDIRMPVMDGIETAKAIRTLGRSDAQLIPIIALSANAFEEDKMESAKAGMNAHLSKPIDVDTLFRSIGQILNSY